jgi:hypothetical protein
MALNVSYYDFTDIKSELDRGDNHNYIGNFLGISDQKYKTWKLTLYLGNRNLLKLFETKIGINETAFEIVNQIRPLTRSSLSDQLKYFIYHNLLIQLDENVNSELTSLNNEFYLYDLNIFDTSENNFIKIEEFLNTWKHNLIQINDFEEGDIISFERSFYTHHAVLTDISRMIVTHRSGEPENPGNSLVISGSLIGLPTDKALVTEDNLVEVGGYRKFSKCNEKYDSVHPPRLVIFNFRASTNHI